MVRAHIPVPMVGKLAVLFVVSIDVELKNQGELADCTGTNSRYGANPPVPNVGAATRLSYLEFCFPNFLFSICSHFNN
jgi:hypothetical protein